MSERETYENQQEFNYFESLVNTKEILTSEEFNFVVAYDSTERVNFSYIGGYGQHGDYLNLNIYSEHDHEKRQYETETY